MRSCPCFSSMISILHRCDALRARKLVLKAQPAQQGVGHLLRLLEQGHVATVFDHNEFRIRDPRGHFLVLRERAPPILASNHNEGRTGDARKTEHEVWAVEEG